MAMIQNSSDYVLCEDGKHAIINMHNGYIETRIINDSCNMDEWETVESKKL